MRAGQGKGGTSDERRASVDQGRSGLGAGAAPASGRCSSLPLLGRRREGKKKQSHAIGHWWLPPCRGRRRRRIEEVAALRSLAQRPNPLHSPRSNHPHPHPHQHHRITQALPASLCLSRPAPLPITTARHERLHHLLLVADSFTPARWLALCRARIFVQFFWYSTPSASARRTIHSARPTGKSAFASHTPHHHKT